MTKSAVIGFGNLLLKDEGIGVHIVQSLQVQYAGSDGVLILDGGTCADVLYLLPEQIDKLIIVDAVKAGGKPGSIYRFTPDDVNFSLEQAVSAHQFGLADGLRDLGLSGKAPKEIIIFGVEPKEISWGLDISVELKAILHKVVDLVSEEISEDQLVPISDLSQNHL